MLAPNPFDTHGRAAKFVVKETKDFSILSLRVLSSQESDPEMEHLSQSLSGLSSGGPPQKDPNSDGADGGAGGGGEGGDGDSGDDSDDCGTIVACLRVGARRPRRRVPLGPMPDPFKPTSDRNQVQVARAQNELNSRMTHRECRHVMLGGPPSPPQQNPYPYNPYTRVYINKFVLPSLFDPELYLFLFGVDVQDFYDLRERFVVPFMGRPYITTADGLCACFLYKLKKNPSDRDLNVIFGCEGHNYGGAIEWFKDILNNTYVNHPLLQLSRSLGQGNNLFALFMCIHQDTRTNTRFCAFFESLRLQTSRAVGRDLLLCCVSWDTRHVKSQKPGNFHDQTRTWSSKSNFNATAKLVAAGLDGKAKLVFMCGASSSPANTDERLVRFMIDMETNAGITGGLKTVLEGHPQFLVINLFDRGYIQYLVRGGQSFFDYMRGVETTSQGRVRFFHPMNSNHSW